MAGDELTARDPLPEKPSPGHAGADGIEANVADECSAHFPEDQVEVFEPGWPQGFDPFSAEFANELSKKSTVDDDEESPKREAPNQVFLSGETFCKHDDVAAYQDKGEFATVEKDMH